MKFAALALTLLLAVGSRAASLPNDAPSGSAVLAAVDFGLTYLKGAINRVFSSLDDEHGASKARVLEAIDEIEPGLKSSLASVSHIIDQIYSTVSDTTTGYHASIQTEIETLNMNLQANIVNLVSVVNSHIKQYKDLLTPISEVYKPQQAALIEEIKERMNPIRDELKSAVINNVKETSSALLLIMESVNTMVGKCLAPLQSTVNLYAQEYGEQIGETLKRLQSITFEDLSNMYKEITPALAEIRSNLFKISQTIGTNS